MTPPAVHEILTAESFFEQLQRLGPVRIISVCGPSVFEAICEVAPFVKQDGFLNMITDAYHWHFAIDRFRHVRSVDTTHARSGRQVLFFELREEEGKPAFLRIYLYRGKGEAYRPDVLERFESLHRELKDGAAVCIGEAE